MIKLITKGVRNRFQPAPRAGISLTSRDVAVVTAALLNPATRGHHFQPLFPSVKVRTERLRLLFDHSYLSRVFPGDLTFGGAVYHVGKAGVPVALAALAARGLEFSEDDIKALSRRPSLSVLDHSLRGADVYSALCLRVPVDNGVRVDQFIPERLVRFDYEVRAAGSGDTRWRRRCFAPDGAVVVSAEGTGPRMLIFLEIDMGTVPIRRFTQQKLQAFTEVAASNLIATRFEATALALAVITVSQGRMRQLIRAGERNQCTPVLLTTFDQIEQAGLSTVWTLSGHASGVTLLDFIQNGGPRCSA